MQQALNSIKVDGLWWQARLWDALDQYEGRLPLTGDHPLTHDEVQALSKWVDGIVDGVLAPKG